MHCRLLSQAGQSAVVSDLCERFCLYLVQAYAGFTENCSMQTRLHDKLIYLSEPYLVVWF
jgi:hypothetical protein